MKEIEIKILDVDPKEVVQTLNDMGAKKIESGLVYITAFDSADGRLLKDGGYIRIRRIGDRTELVLKRTIRKDEFKIAEEFETTVADNDIALRIFEGLGMIVFAKQEKYRASYKLGDIKFELDKNPGMPWLLEVEAGSEEHVRAGVEMLGFKMSQTTSISGKELHEKYGLTNFFTFEEHDESSNYDSLFA